MKILSRALALGLLAGAGMVGSSHEARAHQACEAPLPVAQFDELKGKAEGLEATKKGKKYVKAYLQKVQVGLGAALRKCVDANGEEKYPSRLEILFAWPEKGERQEYARSPSAVLCGCIMDAFPKPKVKAPPNLPFYLYLDINIDPVEKRPASED